MSISSPLAPVSGAAGAAPSRPVFDAGPAGRLRGAYLGQDEAAKAVFSVSSCLKYAGGAGGQRPPAGPNGSAGIFDACGDGRERPSRAGGARG